MKLLTGILGTTLLALTCVATSNIALAGSHERVNRNTICDNGLKLYKNDANQYRCDRRAPSGWRIVNGQNNQNANQTRRIDRNTKCNRGLKLYKNDANQYRCERRAPPGWRIAQMQRMQGGDQMNGNQNFKPIIWKNFKGKQYAFCPRGGWKAFSNGKETRCYKKALRGWSGYRGLQWDHNNSSNGIKVQNGSSMGMQKGGGKYQYDNYRYMQGNKPACKKGRPTYNNYQFHCS